MPFILCLFALKDADVPDLRHQLTLYVVGHAHLDTEWNWASTCRTRCTTTSRFSKTIRTIAYAIGVPTGDKDLIAAEKRTHSRAGGNGG